MHAVLWPGRHFQMRNLRRICTVTTVKGLMSCMFIFRIFRYAQCSYRKKESQFKKLFAPCAFAIFGTKVLVRKYALYTACTCRRRTVLVVIPKCSCRKEQIWRRYKMCAAKGMCSVGRRCGSWCDFGASLASKGIACAKSVWELVNSTRIQTVKRWKCAGSIV